MNYFDISSLEKLKPCVFRYDIDLLPKFDDKLHFGFIAQDLVKLFPMDTYGIVIVNPSNQKLMVNYNEIIPMLTKWQQYLFGIIKLQETKIQDLEKQFEELKSAVQREV